MVNFILYLWQLPQILLAGILFVILKVGGKVKSTQRYEKTRFVITDITSIGCFSLGPIIFITYIGFKSHLTVYHELGHSKQSKILGPLYLLIVGLPSALNNLISRFSKKWAEGYYKRFPENWADKLGGVDRPKPIVVGPFVPNS